jgi:formamidopyrimidine-DNA glycosylase
VRGRKVIAVRRRAKYLLLELERDVTLVVHLGMSGRLTLVPASASRELHEHVSFFLTSGERLRFRDPRRFGLVLALPSRNLQQDRHFRHLGVEPLVNGFDGRRLAGLARGRRGPVKNFLMDSRIVVGVGNIYASEALYRSGIHPARSVARISVVRWDRLARAVRLTLEQAIGQGGTTLNDFTDAAGQGGTFQVFLSVYGREGEVCPRCGKILRRIIQAGRSTFYCVGCQK